MFWILRPWLCQQLVFVLNGGVFVSSPAPIGLVPCSTSKSSATTIHWFSILHSSLTIRCFMLLWKSIPYTYSCIYNIYIYIYTYIYYINEGFISGFRTIRPNFAAHLAIPKDWPVAEAAVGGPLAGKMLPMAYSEASLFVHQIAGDFDDQNMTMTKIVEKHWKRKMKLYNLYIWHQLYSIIIISLSASIFTREMVGLSELQIPRQGAEIKDGSLTSKRPGFTGTSAMLTRCWHSKKML